MAYINVKDAPYNAKGDGKSVSDGAINSGSSTLTSASANFASGDVGKAITVQGAGTSGTSLITTIATRVSATQVTLATSASTTVSGKLVLWATNDSNAIQAAINDAMSQKRPVYVPAVSTYYLVNSTLTLSGSSASGFMIFGDGANSVLYKSSSGDLLQIGDGNTIVSNVIIRDLNFNGAAASGWSLNADGANNLTVQNCNFANSSSASGAARLNNSICSKLLANTFGSLYGSGVGIQLVSSHSTQCVANRIDGTSGQSSTTGIYCGSVQIGLFGNTLESLGIGIDVWSVGTAIIANYFESNLSADILATHSAGPADGLEIIGNTFASTIGIACDLDYGSAMVIEANRSNENYSTAFCRIGDSAKGTRLGRNALPGGSSNTGGQLSGAIFRNASASRELVGNLTSARTIFRVRCLSTSSRFRLKYYVTADNAQTGGSRSETYGTKGWSAQMSANGAWTVNQAVTDELAARSNGTASVVSVNLATGDNTGALVQVSCTNYSGSSAVGVFVLDVEAMSLTPQIEIQ